MIPQVMNLIGIPIMMMIDNILTSIISMRMEIISMIIELYTMLKKCIVEIPKYQLPNAT